MRNNIKIILALCSALFLLGCIGSPESETSEEDFVTTTILKDLSFQDYLEKVNIRPMYSVKYTGGWSSSGGDRSWNVNFVVENGEIASCNGSYRFSGFDGGKKVECTLQALRNNTHPFEKHRDLSTVQDILTNISSFDSSKAKSLKFGNRTCFYDVRRYNYDKVVVCFDEDNHLVNYGSDTGPGTFYYSIDGYEFADQLKNLM